MFEIVEAIHNSSPAKVALQLGHAGRRGSTRPRWEGLDRPLRSQASHEVGYRLATDPAGPPSDHLTSSYLRASGASRGVPGSAQLRTLTRSRSSAGFE